MTVRDYKIKLVGVIRNQWFITTVGSLIGFILVNHILKFGFFTALIHSIILFANFQITVPVYIITLFIILLFFVLKLYQYIPPKRFLSYDEEVINGLLWRWKIDKISKDEYRICDLRPYCPDCKFELSLDRHDYYKCGNPECDTDKLIFREKDEKNEIVKVIKNRIEKKFPLVYKRVDFSEI